MSIEKRFLSGLNASDLTAGLVASGILGSGTANSGTVLLGDNTWTTPSLSLITAGTLAPALTLSTGNSITSGSTQGWVGTSRGMESNVLVNKGFYLLTVGTNGFKLFDGGDFSGSDNLVIGTDTSVSSDTLSLSIGAGGGSDTTRSSFLTFFGANHPDASKAGNLNVSTIAGKSVYFNTSGISSTYALTIATAGITLTTDLILGVGNKIDWGTASGTGTVTAAHTQIVKTAAGVVIDVLTGKTLDIQVAEGSVGTFSNTALTLPSTVSLVLGSASIIDWGSTTGTGTVTSTSAQILNTSAGPVINFPASKVFNLQRAGVSYLTNSSNGQNIIFGTDVAKILIGNVTGNTLTIGANTTAGNHGSSLAVSGGSSISSGAYLRVYGDNSGLPGRAQLIGHGTTGAVDIQSGSNGVNSIAQVYLDPTYAQLGCAGNSVYVDSTGLNILSGIWLFNSATYGLEFYSAAYLDWGTSVGTATITATRVQIASTSLGLVSNVIGTYTHVRQIGGTTCETLSSTALTLPAGVSLVLGSTSIIDWGSTVGSGSITAGSKQIVSVVGGVQTNVPTGKTSTVSVNGVIQTTQDINGLTFQTLAGTVTAGTRGLYTIAAGLTINVETGKNVVVAIQGAAAQTQDATNCTFSTNLVLGTANLLNWGTSAGTGTIGSTSTQIASLSGGMAINVPSAKTVVVSVAGTTVFTLAGTALTLPSAVSVSLGAASLLDWSSTAGTGTVTNGSKQIVSVAGGLQLNVPTGKNVVVSVNGTAVHTQDVTNCTFATNLVLGLGNLIDWGTGTGSGTLTSTHYMIAATSSGMEFNVPSSFAYKFKTNASATSLLILGSGSNEDFSRGIRLVTVGTGIFLKQGTNAVCGTGTLVAGTVTINNTFVATGDMIFVTVITAGGTIGVLTVPTIVNATSFTVTSILQATGLTQTADTSTFNWWILKKG